MVVSKERVKNSLRWASNAMTSVSLCINWKNYVWLMIEFLFI